MTDSDGYFPEHLSHDEYLRRRIRDTDASLQNLADIVFPRLDALEQHLGLDPEAWRTGSGAQSVPGRMTFTVLEKE